MNRKLMSLGMALALILILGGVSSAAQAEEFHSEAESTYLHGEGLEETVFKLGSVSVACKVTTTVGQVTGSTTTKIPLRPIYEKCSALGVAAEIHTHGCTYHIKLPSHNVELVCETTTIEKENGEHETIHHEVEVTVPLAGCVYRIAPQEVSEAVQTTNEGSGSSRSIVVTPIAKGIKAVVEGPALLCGANGTTENVTWEGRMRLRGYTNESMTKQVGIWIL